jgi:lipopolysaccharide cholinephosphotransferase
MEKRKIELCEIQGAELDILLKLIRFLEENNIAYCTSGGTTLGSIRHKGFIPWDDDVDIFVPRKDYDRLLEISMDKLIDGYISIKRPGQKNFACPYAKACNEKTLINEVNVTKDKYKTGIFVDIFPLDKLHNSTFLNRLAAVRAYLLMNMLNTAAGNTNMSKKGNAKWILKSLLSIIQFIPAKLIGAENISYHMDNLGRRAQGFKSDLVGFRVVFIKPECNGYDKALFEEFIDGEFEGHKIKNPVGYDKFLTKRYGDYMKLPPKEEQIMHGFDAWYID